MFTHENRPRTAWFSSSYQDEVAPPGTPFRPLYDEKVYYSGQPIALVVAETFEIARYAASLIRAEYETEEHETDLKLARAHAYVPPKKRSGITPPPKPEGDAMKALCGCAGAGLGRVQPRSRASQSHGAARLDRGVGRRRQAYRP